jgi:hypothetical protein
MLDGKDVGDNTESSNVSEKTGHSQYIIISTK